MSVQLGYGLVAILLSALLTPIITRLARRFGLLEYPNERRVHKKPMPIGGGIALFLAFWLALLFTGNWASGMWGLLVSSALVLITGLIDDLRGLSPLAKLGGQLVAGLVLIASGTRIEFVTNPMGGMLYLSWWSVPVTLLWLIAITNIINFIDGLDGLAAGIVAIACAPMVGVALAMDQPFAALLAVVLAGSVLGFLPYNFNPARIMMGDAGALFLGFMLGAISVEGALKGPTAIAIGVSVLALGLPILDTLFAIMRRLRAGRPFYKADRGHVHHRLLDLGYTQRQAVVGLYAASAALSMVAMAVLHTSTGHALVMVALAMVGVTLIGAHLGLRTWRDE